MCEHTKYFSHFLSIKFQKITKKRLLKKGKCMLSKVTHTQAVFPDQLCSIAQSPYKDSFGAMKNPHMYCVHIYWVVGRNVCVQFKASVKVKETSSTPEAMRH